jgi:hypothetical protein
MVMPRRQKIVYSFGNTISVPTTKSLIGWSALTPREYPEVDKLYTLALDNAFGANDILVYLGESENARTMRISMPVGIVKVLSGIPGNLVQAMSGIATGSAENMDVQLYESYQQVEILNESVFRELIAVEKEVVQAVKSLKSIAYIIQGTVKQK